LFLIGTKGVSSISNIGSCAGATSSFSIYTLQFR
jgi:hypothetical protein